MAGLIGALRITLGIDASEFVRGTSKAKAEMRQFQREFARTGKKMQEQGRNLSTYLTVPILGAGAAVIKMAGDFEASMNRVGISTQASSAQLDQMKSLALDIGKSTTKSASESADAMDMLAKAGMRTEDILNGGARAAVALAEAAGSELDPAASAITDTMAQFKKTTADLPAIINNITGAVNESKFDFADFTMGMAQAGGVAASSGVEFEDFAAALAATSSQFNSGSDAGTSFKTFILRMVPDTKKAREAMEQFGVSFYDASGQMKSMADIAQMLQDKFAGMSEMDRTALFKTMFGTDAIRTAIGLMQAGAKGVEEMQARIAATDASEQAAKRMKGFNAELEKLKGALETLAIKIGDSGLLSAVSGIVTAIAEWVDWMSEAHPTTLKWATAIAAVLAAAGPLWLVFGTGIKTLGLLLPLLTKLGPLFLILKSGISYLIPVVLALGRAMMLMMLNPIGLAITAVAALVLAWQNWDKIKPVIIALYNTVKTYVLDKLNAVWEGVKAGIERVKGFFRGLWDAVVGHSYIPDMVDGIAQHMARLDQVMVQPAQRGADAVKQSFAEMQQSVASILSRLFPEEARHNALKADLDILERGMKALGFTADQTAEAIRRLKSEYADEAIGPKSVPSWIDNPNTTADGPKIDVGGAMDEVVRENERVFEEIGDLSRSKTAEMAQHWADLASRAIGSMRDMVSAFKSGDILGGIQQLLDTVLGVAQAFGGLKGWGPPGGGASAPRAPGFSTGGSFKVGGSGGVDSQLIRLRATPGEMVDVRRGDQGRRESIIVYVKKGEMFDAHVERVARPMADRAAVVGATAGAGMAQKKIMSTNRNTIPS